MVEKFDLEALKREFVASDERGDAKFTIDFHDMTIVLERLEQAEQALEATERQVVARSGETAAERIWRGRAEQAEQQVARVRAMAQDWEANGNSCAVGDRSADVWHATENAILRALDGEQA